MMMRFCLAFIFTLLCFATPAYAENGSDSGSSAEAGAPENGANAVAAAEARTPADSANAVAAADAVAPADCADAVAVADAVAPENGADSGAAADAFAPENGSDSVAVADVGDATDGAKSSKAQRAKIMGPEFPYNSRRIPLGYILGGSPTPESLEVLQSIGIKLVFSISNSGNEEAIHEKCESLGMAHHVLRMRKQFPKPSTFVDILNQYKPEEIYLHCKHGGDRSAAVLAFLLVYRHGWDPAEAILAMMNDAYSDISGLKMVFEEKGIPWKQEQANRYLAIYTNRGGLKGRNERYRRLLRTVIDAMMESKK